MLQIDQFEALVKKIYNHIGLPLLFKHICVVLIKANHIFYMLLCKTSRVGRKNMIPLLSEIHGQN